MAYYVLVNTVIHTARTLTSTVNYISSDANMRGASLDLWSSY